MAEARIGRWGSGFYLRPGKPVSDVALQRLTAEPAQKNRSQSVGRQWPVAASSVVTTLGYDGSFGRKDEEGLGACSLLLQTLDDHGLHGHQKAPEAGVSGFEFAPIVGSSPVSVEQPSQGDRETDNDTRDPK